MEELYEAPSDLFVAGMAAGNHRVAVFSLLRYNPLLSFSTENWFDIHVANSSLPECKQRQVLLQRSCKLLVHEVCHLLGIDHCIYYECCMNGSGHLDEDFRQPMFLCPVDLHKLQHLVGFDVQARYNLMKNFFMEHEMTEETHWLEKRLKCIRSV